MFGLCILCGWDNMDGLYCPYTDVTLYPTFDISTVPDLKYFSLGFIISDTNKNPSWGGHFGVGSTFYKDIIAKVRAKGGDCICSFGGADGRELATVCGETDLFAKYKRVIDTYSFKSIDFDIEGPTLADTRANATRAKVVVELQNLYRDLRVSLTLPVDVDGLDKMALDVVQETPCDLVNIMAMDFGDVDDMGKAACDAALATRKQTGKNIGITVMIGMNDDGNVFDLGDAETVKEFQKNNVWVKRLSIWAIERDAGKEGDLDHSSQVKEASWAYSKIFSSL